MYGSQEKILGQKVNVKFFTVDTYSVGTGVPRTFLELGKIQKNIFLKIKTSTIKSEKNKYQTIHSTNFIFNFFGIFTIFLYFSRFFENLNSVFWKKYANFLTLPQPNFTTGLGFLAIFQRPWVCQGLWKIDEPIENCTWWSVEAWEYSFFRNLVFAKLEQLGFFT